MLLLRTASNTSSAAAGREEKVDILKSLLSECLGTDGLFKSPKS